MHYCIQVELLVVFFTLLAYGSVEDEFFQGGDIIIPQKLDSQHKKERLQKKLLVQCLRGTSTGRSYLYESQMVLGLEKNFLKIDETMSKDYGHIRNYNLEKRS